MIDVPLDEALSTAYGALAGRQSSPLEALAVAVGVVERDDVSDEARIVGYWAMAAAERELSRLADAEAHMRAAIALAVTIDDELLVAQVSSALVLVLGASGRADEALDLARSVEHVLPPMERADLDMKRATVLEDLGRIAEAVNAYTDALTTIELGPDRVLEARLRCNRAVALAYQGRIEEALDDCALAERLATDHEQYFLAGGAAHNHAFAAGLQGDIVTALASFGRADGLYAQVGYPGRSAGVLASDRCELMLAAGLTDEARANAEIAVSALGDGGDVNNLAEARLLLARACLAQGDVEAAHREAQVALAQFRQANREGWAAMAEYVAIRALQVTPTQSTDLLVQADVIAGHLERLGWSTESASVRVSSAELAIELGDTAFARAQLVLAARARDQGRPDRRASAWLATAMLRRSERDRAGARRAVTAGLDLLARHQTTLGATDLRVGATAHARKLAELGLAMAIESRRPRDVLVWAERVRANALSLAPARPPADSPLAAALGELRRQRAELDDARRSMRADQRQELAVARMEATVRDLARTVRGGVTAKEHFSVPALMSRLGDHRELVEYVEVDGALAAVVVDVRRCTLRHLGALAPVQSALELALFSLTRLARVGGSEASRSASLDSLSESLDVLDALLVQPLRLRTGEGGDPVVIVPTGVLHGMPWASLPGLRERATSVATSATRWRPVAGRTDPNAAVGLIAGPELSGTDREMTLVESMYPSTERLSGDEATVSAALELLERSETAHIACHGHFRRDSPMFSSLGLADGALTVYDIERLATPPSVVVLPACNAGTAAVSVGDELIGTASALLGTGVRSVIAPVTVVNDEATVEVMARLHRHLAAGRTPSGALAATRTETAATSPGNAAALAAAWSLLCLE